MQRGEDWMIVPRTVLALLAAAAAALGLAACGGGDDDSLVVYSGRNQDLVGKLLQQYQDETGAKLEIRYGDSADLAATLLEEGDKTPADVFLSQDAGALGALQAEGRLAPLDRPLLDAVEPRYRSDEGRWVGLTGRARVIAYDKRELKPAELPQSALDVPAKEWRGRVGWAPTNPSFESFVTAMRKLHGEERARALARGDGRQRDEDLREQHRRPRRDRQRRGRRRPDQPLLRRRGDRRGGRRLPGRPVLPARRRPGLAHQRVRRGPSSAGAENRPAAERFVRFLLGREAQRYFADETKEYPLAAGVRPDPALTPLSEIDAPRSTSPTSPTSRGRSGSSRKRGRCSDHGGPGGGGTLPAAAPPARVGSTPPALLAAGAAVAAVALLPLVYLALVVVGAPEDAREAIWIGRRGGAGWRGRSRSPRR
jgi:iron(III) transport system substrate-binding protein